MRCTNCLRILKQKDITITPTFDFDYPEDGDANLIRVLCPYCAETETIIIKKK